LWRQCGARIIHILYYSIASPRGRREKVLKSNSIINREVKTINIEIVYIYINKNYNINTETYIILIQRYNTRIVDDGHRQVTITVIGDWSISVRLDVFMSFVTGMHLAVPLTSALYFNSIAFVMVFVLSSHSTGLPVDVNII